MSIHEKVLIAQYKDLADYDKVHGPKIKAMDDEIAVLQKKIEAIGKRKAVREKTRDELLVDHKAEIRNVFTAEQRIDRLSRQIRGSAVYYQYWAVLPQAAKTSLKSRCDAAAVELIQAGKADDRDAVSASAGAIRRDADKLLTPKLRRNGESEYLYNSAMQKFTRIKLTDAQKDSVRQLCSKAAEKKVRISAQYAQVSKDREALRRAIYGQRSRTLYYKIREDAVQSILTDEQLKQGGFKRKSPTAGKKP